MWRLGVVLWTVLGVAAWAAAPEAVAAAGPEETSVGGPERFAPLIGEEGLRHHPISTDEPLAQRYFDQGLTLAYGFNHAEAERSFRQAATLDPECAMCWWGVALVHGPNINNPAMDEAAVAAAWEALGKARELAAAEGVPARERDYVAALAERYVAPAEASEDRAALDLAYAEAMERLARRYPDDLDAATLYGEALMDTMPWDYWTEAGEPRPATRTVLDTFERVLAADPDHPGANHLLIHAVEKVAPERGVAAADRLRTLVPWAGHLVHMPSHIYLRIGRYQDAVLANQLATEADERYTAACHAQGLYPLAYVPHNHHFLWVAASLAGQRAVALEAARQVAEHTDHSMMREPGLGTLQHYWTTPLYSLVRFGRWEEILEAPEPPADLVYPRGVWHYARGQAFVRTGRRAAAEAEYAALAALADDPRLEGVTIWDLNTTIDLLAIARHVLAGELAAAGGDVDRAAIELRQAIDIEDALTYDEPPPWDLPVRQVLGAILLEAGRAAEAEAVYRADLERFPENGWSLYGLHRALLAQERTDEAAAVETRFRAAWASADTELAGSRF